MEPLKLKEPESVVMDYDREADVLYVSFGEPRQAIGLELSDGVVARYQEESGELVGLTFIGLKALLEAEQP